MDNKPRILVVEDENDLKDLLLLHLKREGYDAVGTDNGEDALKLFNSSKFNLAVLDWMLPGLSGLEICKSLFGRLPILMVTARADSSDIVLALESGADDYIVKPFEIPVLLARVKSLLRRSLFKDEKTGKLQIGELILDSEAHSVTCAEEVLHMTNSEFNLLKALMSHRGSVLSRERLISFVQGEGVAVTDRVIDVHIAALRKKLGSCSDIVETIRGVGYRVKL